MLKKKRMMGLILSLVTVVGLLAGCGNKTAANTPDTESQTTVQSQSIGKKRVVCTIFPEYDWAKEIIGELGGQYDLTLLLDNGVDLHSYQPTAEDIAKIAECDVFVYVGGESDGWVEDALKETKNKDRQVINLLDVLGDTVKEEEAVEGMEPEDEAEPETGAEGEEGPEYDEHVWLSLKNAKVLVEAMTDAMKKVDSDNGDTLQSNCNAYIQKLEDLDQAYETGISEGTKHTLVFGDRFPFRYMVDDYDLDYYAAFAGCSAETEASFETIIFLAEKVDELNLSHVMVIENSDQKLARTIINNTADKNQTILELDSMQSTASQDIAAGETYLSAMEKNLDILKMALK